MKPFPKIITITLASLMALLLAACFTLATTSPNNIPKPETNVRAVPSIVLPAQFKNLTTTDKIFINGTPISLVDGDYVKSLSEKDLKNIELSSKYVLTFSENEKWVKLKDGQEDITKSGVVKGMTVTKAFLKEAKQSLQDFLKDDDYYSLDLWNSIIDPSIFKAESSTTDSEARYYVQYVDLEGPPKEKIEALKLSAQSLSKNDEAIILILSPIEDTKLRFTYKFTDTSTKKIYTTISGVELTLKFSRIIFSKDPQKTPKFQWKLERAIH